ncbi:MAG: DNA methyltransferase [Pseudomonadota bacterium]
MSKLFFGDNLEILRKHVEQSTVDLVYLDPPFNSKANYNILFKAPSGGDSQAQIEAFEDTWHWNATAELAFDDVMQSGNTSAFEMLSSVRSFLGENDMMAYLTMMTVRLIELHRVLKDTGSIYLHCDPTASHYLKIMMDSIFGAQNFRNEIIWRRTGSHNSTKRYGPIHDVVLFYTKSGNYVWNKLTRPYMQGHVDKAFRFEDGQYRTNYSGNILTGSGTRNGISGKPWRGFDPTKKGRHWALPSKLLEGLSDDLSSLSQHEKMDYLYEKGLITIKEGDEWPRYQRIITSDEGQYLPDIWAYQPYTEGTVFNSDDGVDADVRWMGTKDSERLGYPTQKPLGLLSRIISTSSEPGDVVLDPFCGCGTAIHAAEKQGRQWIGIDVTHLAITLIEKRMRDAFPSIEYEVEGSPRTVEGAQDLADRDKYQFEWWALSLIGAMPFKGKKKGSDGGIDGILYFRPEGLSGKPKKAIVSVKGGKNVGVSMIRDLLGTVENDKDAEIGIFICLAEPTSHMSKEAVKSGFYQNTSWGKVPRIQMFTIDDLLNQGKAPQIPALDPTMFKKAQAEIDEMQSDFFNP